MVTARVAIILPTYNGSARIGEAIASVLAQTWTDWDLKIVIDGSTDDTFAVVERFDDPRISFLRLDSNQGVGAARNAGIQASTSEYLAFIDDDDRWLPEKLARQISLLSAAPELGLVHAGIVDRMEDGRGLRRLPPRNANQVRENLVKDCIATSTVVVRRSVVEKIGLFDPELRAFQDWDLWLRILASYPVSFVPEILAVANQLSDSIQHDDPRRLARYRMRVINRHWRRIKSHHLERRVLAYHHTFVAGHLLLGGQRQAARKRAYRSLRLSRSLRAGLIYAVSWLGARPARVAWRFLQRARRFLRV